MLKIAVFGIGRGGEAVARFLATELSTVEVIEVIDWSNPNGAYRSLDEMYRAAEYFLSPYIRKVDLIVLADYTLSLVRHSLAAHWPEQKIVGMEIEAQRISKACPNADVVTLLANEVLMRSELGKEIYRQLSCAEIIALDCSGWETLIDVGEMSRDILEIELGKTLVIAKDDPPVSRPRRELPVQATLRGEVLKFLLRTSPMPQLHYAMTNGETVAGMQLDTEFRPDRRETTKKRRTEAICILSSHFWTIKRDLEVLFDYRVRIVDFRRELLHDVCLALKLRGVDGRLGE